MDTSSFLGLIQNATLLLSVAFIFDLLAKRWRTGQILLRQIPVGLVIGAIGITIMMTPWTFAPGIVFDTRSVLIGISGFFFGTFTTAIVITMIAAFRYYQGGTGAWTGIAVIIVSGLIGITWRHLRHRRLSDISWRELYLFGIVIHLVMLATMLTLPWETALLVLSNIALPVIIIYPAGTALLGVLMVNRVRRERSEDALLESEEKYRSLVENISDMIYTLDSVGRFTYVSPVIEKLSSYKAVDLIGKNFADFVYPDDLPGLIESFNRTVQGDLQPFEYRIMDGNKVRYARSSSQVILKDGVFVGLTGLMTDITERKLAEETLKQSEEYFRCLIEDSLELVTLIREDGTILYESSSSVRILGYEPEELVGKNTMEYIHPDDLEKAIAALSPSQTGETQRSIEIRFRHKDGTWLLLQADGRDLRNHPSVKGIVINSRDITSRKRSEEEKCDLQERLNRAEKMEALGTLAGGVAHDLNNVLGIIVGYSEMILDEVDEKSSLKRPLVNIFNSGQKAAAIVDDLLTLARRGVPGSNILNLNKIIKDSQQSPELSKLLSHHISVKIKTDLDSDLLNISGSSVHLNKSLYNLISNACEAMNKGGILTIKTTNQYLDKPMSGYDEIKEGDYVVLSVSDTGEGISEKDMKRIFEPFYTKKIMGRSGTGLGLAVVWGTVTDHNGYINVRSEEGQGSTFTLYFPVTREEIPTEALAIDVSAYLGNGQSILIVDDVSIQRELATDMLKKLNYNVDSVKSGEEAILYLKDHQPDLIVLDMIMDPGMDGLDTYKSIIKTNPKQKTIIVSGFSESERVKEAKRLGVGTYVRKPYIKERLGLAVKKEIEKKAEGV